MPGFPYRLHTQNHPMPGWDGIPTIPKWQDHEDDPEVDQVMFEHKVSKNDYNGVRFMAVAELTMVYGRYN